MSGVNDPNIEKLAAQMRDAFGGDIAKIRALGQRLQSSIADPELVPLEPMSLIGYSGPSRREVWAMFAAAYGSNHTSQGFPLGHVDAAGMADALLAEYDQRCEPGQLLSVDDEDDEAT